MKKRILGVLLAVLLAFSFVACGGDGDGGGSGKTTTVKLWYYGDDAQLQAYEAMIDNYNKGQGKIDNIKISAQFKGADSNVYNTSVLTAQSSEKSGPDVYFVWERFFKSWVQQGYTVNLNDYVAAAEADGTLNTSEMYKSSVERFRYDKALNISGPNEDIYGLPIDTSPTALFYNKDAMKNAGIKVISVAEEDLDAWNAGGVEDKYGNTKEALGITIDVPKKGYFRSGTPFQGGEGKTKSVWTVPATGEVLIFNDQIAMNWDEVEDIGFLLTGNSAAGTDYGFYTEWWFAYGWSVGGDCVEDMSGNGSYVYSHGDYSANYIVKEGQTYTGRVTGRVYQAGETLEFLDKMNVNDGDQLYPDQKGGYKVGGSYSSSDVYTGGTLLGGEWNGELTSEQTIHASVKEAATGANAKLIKLPSIREAFTRFTRLAGKTDDNGLGLCPNTTQMSTSSIQYFTDGDLGLILERADKIPLVESYARFEWATAPLPRYKQYVNPTDPMDDTVAVLGKEAGHSEGIALVIRPKSKVKDQAFKVMTWLVGPEAQAIKAEYGLVPNQSTETGTNAFLSKLDPNGDHNAQIFLDASVFEDPGDWWYLEDKDWIDIWATPLNNQVRQGTMTLNDYFNTYIATSNNTVMMYGNYGGLADDGKNYATIRIAA